MYVNPPAHTKHAFVRTSAPRTPVYLCESNLFTGIVNNFRHVVQLPLAYIHFCCDTKEWLEWFFAARFAFVNRKYSAFLFAFLSCKRFLYEGITNSFILGIIFYVLSIYVYIYIKGLYLRVHQPYKTRPHPPPPLTEKFSSPVPSRVCILSINTPLMRAG